MPSSLEREQCRVQKRTHILTSSYRFFFFRCAVDFFFAMSVKRRKENIERKEENYEEPMSSTSIITASYDKQVRFWDPNSGRTIRSFVFQESQVNCLAVSPDRCRLAVAGYGLIRYYDTASSSQCPPVVASFEASSAGNFTAIGHIPIVNSNGALLYATSEDGVLRLLDPRSAPNIRLLREFPTGIAMTCAALSADNNLLFTGGQIGRVSVWHCPSLVADAASSHHTAAFAKPLQEIYFPGDHTAIRSIAVSPTVQWVAVATNSGKVHALKFLSPSPDQLKGGLLAASSHQRSCSALENSSNLTQGTPVTSEAPTMPLASQTSDQPADDSQSPTTANAPTPPAMSPVTSTPPPAATRAAHVSLTPLQQQYHLELVHTMLCHNKYILKVAISPDGKVLATCSADYTVGLWQVPQTLDRSDGPSSPASPQRSAREGDPSSPAPLAATLQPTQNLTNSSVASPRQPNAVVTNSLLSSPDQRAPSISLSAAAAVVPAPLSSAHPFPQLKLLQGHSRWVWDCAFSPCSTALVTVGSDNQVRLWNSILDKPKSDVFVGHSKPVVCVILDTDRRKVDS